MANRYFQWIAGEQKGQVKVFEKLESEGAEVFIIFKDGSRINENLVSPLNQTDLTGKFMAEVDDPSNIWTFKEEWVGRTEEKWVEQDETNPGNKVCVDPGSPGKKVIKLVPPKPTPKTHSVFGSISDDKKETKTPETSEPISTIPVVETTQISQPKIDATDPVFILMSKSKKEDSDITMTMTISLPPKSLYDIAKQSFEGGDQKFIEYIVENITVNEIKDALKDAITDMYENVPIIQETLTP